MVFDRYSGQNCIRFMGTKGSLDFPNLRLWTSTDDAANWYSSKAAKDFPLDLGDAFTRQIDHFADVIAGRAQPKITAADATLSLQATLAVLEAARTGARVELSGGLSATVVGHDVGRHSHRVKASIGYMSQRFSLYLDLVAQHNLEFFAGLYGWIRPVLGRGWLAGVKFGVLITVTSWMLTLGYSGVFAVPDKNWIWWAAETPKPISLVVEKARRCSGSTARKLKYRSCSSPNWTNPKTTSIGIQTST